MQLAFEGISKSFPGVRALNDVSFTVNGGSVHGLCGENGAGKSTLLKILSGAIRPDEGTLRLDSDRLAFGNPADAIRAGIAIIYQELHLAPEMSVAENILVGNMSHRAGYLNRSENRRRCREVLSMIGIDLDPDRRVGSLSIAQRQMVEIAKALSRNAQVIAFDEPTSSLSTREAAALFAVIEELGRQGRVILYVSHRMEEILSICNACTVLRDGTHVVTFESTNGVTSQEIVSRMVGRDLADVYGYRSRHIGNEVLTVEGLAARGIVSGQSLSVRQGEIVGVFGLIGAGRSELLNAIYGLTRSTGLRRLGGRELNRKSPAESISRGMYLCPEDRKHQGLFMQRSVRENLNIAARKDHAWMGALINDRWEGANASLQIQRLAIKTPSPSQQILYLSGGNQQKAILGRWLSGFVQVLLLDEPTRGVDIGAKREIYDLIYGLAESGTGVLLVSSDLPEVMGVSDRILVMREGAIVSDVPRDEFDEALLLSMALPGPVGGHSA